MESLFKTSYQFKWDRTVLKAFLNEFTLLHVLQLLGESLNFSEFFAFIVTLLTIPT